MSESSIRMDDYAVLSVTCRCNGRGLYFKEGGRTIMPKLKDEERDEFLAKLGVIMNIATVDGDGAPLVTPIWFVHEEGVFGLLLGSIANG